MNQKKKPDHFRSRTSKEFEAVIRSQMQETGTRKMERAREEKNGVLESRKNETSALPEEKNSLYFDIAAPVVPGRTRVQMGTDKEENQTAAESTVVSGTIPGLGKKQEYSQGESKGESGILEQMKNYDKKRLQVKSGESVQGKNWIRKNKGIS